MATPQFDLIIVGGGPGGYVAAIRAAQLGMSAACVEKEKSLGGTCLRIGCIPSKALLDSSELYAQAQHHFATHGILADNVRLDLAAMLKRKDKVVKTLTGGVASLLKKNKVTRLLGAGVIAAPGRVDVVGEDAGSYTAKHIIVATGSQPIELPFMPFDGARIVDSTAALSFPEVPKRLLVVGGGAIGLELGSVWSRLGSKVLVVEALDRLVPGMDAELADELKKVLEKQGIAIQLGAKVKGAKIAGSVVNLDIEGEIIVGFERERIAKALGI